MEGEPLSRDGAGDVLGQALSRPDAFSIVVERDGKKVELTVPAEKANDHG